MKIVGGILIIAGGIYVLVKTKAGQKAWDSLANQKIWDCMKEKGTKLAESFSEGYAEVVKGEA